MHKHDLSEALINALEAHHQKTLRDQFAMAAVTGLFASPNTVAGTGTINDVVKTVSEVAYLAADAALEARTALKAASTEETQNGKEIKL